MTMLRQDAEGSAPPSYVLTLTSREPDTDSAAYRRFCATFWQAWRRRWGDVEYCGFIEWTTGTGRRSGGHRRLHSHWLLKCDPLELELVREWVSAEWSKLTGAWVVHLAALEHAGGVVGYLALHHEKMEQAPPPGWEGRRLRPSRGYFSEPGHLRRARARAWLAQRREDERDFPRPFGQEEKPRLVWRTTEWEKLARSVTVEEGRSFDSLPARRELERQLADVDAPASLDELSALARFEEQELAAMARAFRRKRLRELEEERRCAIE